jgi:hypothetical protein
MATRSQTFAELFADYRRKLKAALKREGGAKMSRLIPLKKQPGGNWRLPGC